MRAPSIVKALTLLTLASCTHNLDVFDKVTVRPARNVDILFVLDNSPDRSRYDQMAAQLDILQDRLRDVDGQLPDLHVGTVTTDLGTRGTKDTLGPSVLNCAGDGDAAKLQRFGAGISSGYLEDLRGANGARVRNFDSNDLKLELSRLTNPAAGTANTGCEFEQPLEAMRRALDPSVNPGFIRQNALLSVVFLTTEDDCSFARNTLLDASDSSLGPLASFRCTEQGVICDGDDLRRPGVRTNCRPREGSQFMVDVTEYTAFLKGYKKDPRDVSVSVVAGSPTPFEVREVGVPTLAPSCQGPSGMAWPAVRLAAFADSLGGTFINTCTQENAYQQITAPILNRQRTCFPNLSKDDGENCTVLEIAGATQTELMRCPAGNTNTGSTACWYTYTDEAACVDGEHVGIAVRRGNSTALAGSRIEATCYAK
jgi:hypothetical protein